jgi:hypothetical protein
LAAGGLVLGVIWAGPVADQLAHDPGNLGRMLSFFRHPPSGLVHGHSVHDAVVAVSNEATRPLFGPPPVNRLSRRGAGLLAGAALLGALSAAVGWKRSRFTAVLGGLGAVSLVVTVVATTRVVGDLEPYLFAWTPALLLPPLAAAGLVVLDRTRAVGGPLLTKIPRLGVAALAAIGALLVRNTIRHPTISYTDSPDAAPAARLIEDQVHHDRDSVFPIHVVDGQFEMSSLLLKLVRDGYRFRMVPSYGLYTGSTNRQPQGGIPVIVIGTTASPTPPSATPLGTVGPFVFTTVARL